MRTQLDMKEKMLQSEENLRRQLEVQMNKLTNTKIHDKMMRASMDSLHNRNSLETPVMSPEPHRIRNSHSGYLYYK